MKPATIYLTDDLARLLRDTSRRTRRPRARI